MGRHGENIRKRKDGRWEGRYKIFDKNKQKNIYRSIYGKTYEEVKEKLFQARLYFFNRNVETENIKEQLNSNKTKIFADERLLSSIAEQWLIEVKKTRKYSTYVKYSTIYKTHLKAQLNFCVLSNDSIQELHAKIFDHLSETELSESLKKSICCVANQIFNFANQNNFSNIPMLKRSTGKEKKKSLQVLSETEQRKLFNYIYHNIEPFGVAILLCLYAGLRLGELCALKWTDLDLQSQILTINRTVQRIAGNEHTKRTILLETEPKSESSKRIIPLTSEIVTLLISLDNGQLYIFGDSKPLEPRRMQYRFKNILKKAGLSNYNFHILRHTFATNCVENGMDTKSLCEILGHSDVKITLNRYVHPTMEFKRKQMDFLSDFYGHICGKNI